MSQPSSHITTQYEDIEQHSTMYSNIFYSIMEDLDSIFREFGWMKYTDVSPQKHTIDETQTQTQTQTRICYRKTDIENNYYDFVVCLDNGSHKKQHTHHTHHTQDRQTYNTTTPYVQVSFPLKNSKYNVSVNIPSLPHLGTFILDKLHYFG